MAGLKLWRHIAYQQGIIVALASSVSPPPFQEKHQHLEGAVSPAQPFLHCWLLVITEKPQYLLCSWKGVMAAPLEDEAIKICFEAEQSSLWYCVWVALYVCICLARGEGKISSAKKLHPSVLILHMRGSYSSVWESVNVGMLFRGKKCSNFPLFLSLLPPRTSSSSIVYNYFSSRRTL